MSLLSQNTDKEGKLSQGLHNREMRQLLLFLIPVILMFALPKMQTIL